MIQIKEAIVVEGRYDANTLRQIVDAPIFETGGFAVFNDKERLALLRAAAEKRGLIILTDSDGAGFVIRRYLSGAIDPKRVKHAYIPDVPGKERRKDRASKEGKLGVEGMRPEVLIEALRRCGATILGEAEKAAPGEITKTDLYLAGLSGTADSAEKRKALLSELNLPERMSANALLRALNMMMTKEEFQEKMEA